MTADGLNVFDVEEAILNGRISHRQKDAMTGEWKYLIRGTSLEGNDVVVVVRFGKRKKLVLITIYREKPTNGKVR